VSGCRRQKTVWTSLKDRQSDRPLTLHGKLPSSIGNSHVALLVIVFGFVVVKICSACPVDVTGRTTIASRQKAPHHVKRNAASSPDGTRTLFLGVAVSRSFLSLPLTVFPRLNSLQTTGAAQWMRQACRPVNRFISDSYPYSSATGSVPQWYDAYNVSERATVANCTACVSFRPLSIYTTNYR